jgi:hypothetical protein
LNIPNILSAKGHPYWDEIVTKSVLPDMLQPVATIITDLFLNSDYPCAIIFISPPSVQISCNCPESSEPENTFTYNVEIGLLKEI